MMKVVTNIVNSSMPIPYAFMRLIVEIIMNATLANSKNIGTINRSIL